MTENSRRRFFKTAGAVGAVAATAGLVAGCTDGEEEASPDSVSQPDLWPFRGRHQAGVTAPLAAAGLVSGLDVRVDNRAELASLLADLGNSIEKVMGGEPYELRPGGFPPYDTGIIQQNEHGPAGISVVVGYGASLFDDRFGLADRRPAELIRMPVFFNDYLVRPERSHGDLSITVNANNADAAAHAFRQIMRETRGELIPRWMKEGFNHLLPDRQTGQAPVRNLMGFKDGTANLDSADEALMDDLVWVREDDGQPEWALGGTYQAVRVIRMMVEFWDRTRLNEQEDIFGRHRDTGAPLGMVEEVDTPEFADLESHIARANPRTPGSEENRILRRGFNYSTGFDGNDQLYQGLVFFSYQRSLEKGFITVQRRLDGEVLEEYIRPLGGGFFFVPPPPADGEALGAALTA
ncbi:MAG: Dyp-type peroxidase [Actinomycetota bacterium]